MSCSYVGEVVHVRLVRAVVWPTLTVNDGAKSLYLKSFLMARLFSNSKFLASTTAQEGIGVRSSWRTITGSEQRETHR